MSNLIIFVAYGISIFSSKIFFCERADFMVPFWSYYSLIMFLLYSHLMVHIIWIILLTSLDFNLSLLLTAANHRQEGRSVDIVEIFMSNFNFLVVSSSGGNAGLAAALACKKMDIPCTVIVPGSTPQVSQTQLLVV